MSSITEYDSLGNIIPTSVPLGILNEEYLFFYSGLFNFYVYLGYIILYIGGLNIVHSMGCMGIPLSH